MAPVGIAPRYRKQTMHQPLVAVSTDVRQFDNYTWHAAPQQYLEAALSAAGVFPVLVPSFGDRLDLDRLLASVDGVMVTGSKSNVHPSLYGGDASEANGPYDPARDATTLAADPQGDRIRRAAARHLPRHPGTERRAGRYAGDRDPGTRRDRSITARRSSDNQDERFAIRQPVAIKPGSCLAGVFGAGEIKVNSVHRQAVDRLGSRLAGRSRRRGWHRRGGFGQGQPRLCGRRAVASRNTG